MDCDVCIIGAGLSGLYAAFKILSVMPERKVIVLEKSRKVTGGRMEEVKIDKDVRFSGGAGVVRDGDDSMRALIKELDIKTFVLSKGTNYMMDKHVDPVAVISLLKEAAATVPFDRSKTTFQAFASSIIGKDGYEVFRCSVGYTDLDNSDVYDILEDPGFDDMILTNETVTIPSWTQLTRSLVCKIKSLGGKIFTDHQARRIRRRVKDDVKVVYTTDGMIRCKLAIIATTNDQTKKLVKGVSNTDTYDHIKDQAFMRCYVYVENIEEMARVAKADIHHPTIRMLCGNPLQVVIDMFIPGWYMFYSDNQNAIYQHTVIGKSKSKYAQLLQQTFGIPVKISKLKPKYWDRGTHYFTPLPKKYKDRNEFIIEAQHPAKDVYVVGESVAKQQGWSEGALESVQEVLPEILNRLTHIPPIIVKHKRSTKKRTPYSIRKKHRLSRTPKRKHRSIGNRRSKRRKL